MSKRLPGIAALLALFLIILLVGLALYFRRSAVLPAPNSPRYADIVSAFYKGTLALNTSNPIAPDELLKATQLAPGEPATWTNLAIYRLRQSDLTGAQQALAQAEKLAPNNPEIQGALGQLALKQGHDDAAVAALRKAVGQLPKNVKARYALFQALNRPGQNAEKEARAQLEAIAKILPRSVFVQEELATLAVQTGDAPLLRQSLTNMAAQGMGWSVSARQQLKTVQAAAGQSPRAAAIPLRILANLLLSNSSYGRERNTVGDNAEQTGVPLERFIVLPSPSPKPAAPDTATVFAVKSLTDGTEKGWTLARAVVLAPPIPSKVSEAYTKSPDEPEAGAHSYGFAANAGGPTVTLLANGRQVKISGLTQILPFPGGPKATPPTPNGLLTLDWNNDFRPDLLLAGAGGLRFFQQDGKGGFADVTAKTSLPPAVMSAAYSGAWAFDIEADGDLDVVLAPVSGPPVVLQNNGDGSWTPTRPFPGVASCRAFAAADLDGDVNPDAVFLDASGHVFAFRNDHSGHFSPFPTPPALPASLALAAADSDADGVMDVTLWGSDGAIRRLKLSVENGNAAWTATELTRGPKPPTDGSASLFWTDWDNNGALDLTATSSAGSAVWLGGENGKLTPLAAKIDARNIAAAAPFDAPRLDLSGVGADGVPLRLKNSGAKNYARQIVQPRAQGTGDNRINSFGIGGEMETRAGLLYQKQAIDGPTVRFGLGENKELDCVRVNWPNGTYQSECQGLTQSAPFVAIQYLKSSCPWLFAWDGKTMKLVTDCIWRSPLGLRINAQGTAGIGQTEDWVKIRGDQLVPRNGIYDLRVTADLWETHFFDTLQLRAIDHPVGTDIWVDERFSIPPPPLKVYATGPQLPVKRATDDNGTDVTDILRERDLKYLDTFGRGQYQGVTRDHWVEIELNQNAAGPLWLICNGWIHPTDSSINVALGQNKKAAPPTGMSLEIPDGNGGWRVARKDLGFPEGKIKTVLINLTGLWKPGEPKKLRIRTNLEIYWDQITSAVGLPKTPLKTTRLTLSGADLNYRGFSQTHQASASVPELPDYDTLGTTSPKWLDLEGFYTRFGDVRPLLTGIDDRYVIMNAGDELRLRFPAAPPPPSGWKRDFVLLGDGWVKDGDRNTGYGAAVIPLPRHGIKNYDAPPHGLANDPVYKAHRADWETYHTRYVAPDAIKTALRP